MVASKKGNTKIQKIHNNQKRKQKKQTTCIIGYFYNILLSVALEIANISQCQS